MNLLIKPTTVKTILNKRLRMPQRQSGIKLITGVTTVISVFKNKQIIEVYCQIDGRFNSKI